MLAFILYVLGAVLMHAVSRKYVKETQVFSIGFAIFWPFVLVAAILMNVCDLLLGE